MRGGQGDMFTAPSRPFTEEVLIRTERRGRDLRSDNDRAACPGLRKTILGRFAAQTTISPHRSSTTATGRRSGSEVSVVVVVCGGDPKLAPKQRKILASVLV